LIDFAINDISLIDFPINLLHRKVDFFGVLLSFLLSPFSDLSFILYQFSDLGRGVIKLTREVRVVRWILHQYHQNLIHSLLLYFDEVQVLVRYEQACLNLLALSDLDQPLLFSFALLQCHTI